MTATFTAGAASGVAIASRTGGPMTLIKYMMGIGIWGLTRLTTNVLLCYQMNYA